MRKVNTAVYAICGTAVCLLALIDFGMSADRTPKRVMMLAGLLILGLMYIGAALATAFSKKQQRAAMTQVKPQQRPAWPLVILVLLLLSVMIGFGIFLHSIKLHDIAVVVLTVPLANSVEAWLSRATRSSEGR